jgi:hypothetical protein
MNRMRSCMARNSTRVERGVTSRVYSSLRGLSGSALSVPLANQPRFKKKRIATTTTASITPASTIFANVKFSTSLPYSGSSIRSGCFLSRSCSSASTFSTKYTPSVYDPEFRYVAAQYEAVCGREEDAIGFLRKAVEGKFCSYPTIDSDPLFSPLRHTAEFQEIRSAAVDCQNKFLAYRSQHH